MLTISNPDTFDWSSIALEDCLFGNAMDTLMTFRVYSKLKLLLEEAGRLKIFEKLISPGLDYFSKVEYIGIDIDENALDREDKSILNKLETIETEFKDLVQNKELNINSGPQLIELFFESDTGLSLYPVKKTDKGQPSLDSDSLNTMMELLNKELMSRNA